MDNTVRQYIHRHQLLVPDETLLVGVSGGADSLALLHLLLRFVPEWGVRLHVATLNHGLRGAAGAQDAAFVAQCCAAWALPVTVGQVDVPALAAEQRLNIEAAARHARYDFLATVAGQVGAARVAVGHHADDQAETVLLHLLRGAGLEGLRGMAASALLPGHPQLTLIRPLLAVTRAQIDAYCRKHALTPREDASNSDTTYTRNAIRHVLLPQLAQVNPQVSRALVQLAEVAAVESDYLEAQLTPFLRASVRQLAPQRVQINRAALTALHPALARRALRRAAAQAGALDSSYEQITAALDVARTGQVGALALLPGGVRLRVDYALVYMEHDSIPLPLPEQTPLMHGTDAVPVLLPGVTTAPGMNGMLYAVMDDKDNAAGARLVLPAGCTVTLRTRRAGDRWQPLGMQGHSVRLKDWMINRKIPYYLRDLIPLLLVDECIAAILYPDSAGKWAPSAVFALTVDTAHYTSFHWITSGS